MRYDCEPPYPINEVELDAYCQRAVGALSARLGDRLVCIILCGSWARGEATPPTSDVDLAVVIDAVDAEALELLGLAWTEVGLGCANVYGVDEVPSMPREALEMYTSNATVLWGENPFPSPTRVEFAADLARAAETVARDARSLLLYDWLTPKERERILTNLLGKYELTWALKSLTAYRCGMFPRTNVEMRERLVGTAEGRFLDWLDSLNGAEWPAYLDKIAAQLSAFARNWLLETRSGASERAE